MLGKAHYSGNKKIGTDKLEEDLSLFPGQRITPNLITNLGKKIKASIRRRRVFNSRCRDSIIRARFSNNPHSSKYK